MAAGRRPRCLQEAVGSLTGRRQVGPSAELTVARALPRRCAAGQAVARQPVLGCEHDQWLHDQHPDQPQRDRPPRGGAGSAATSPYQGHRHERDEQAEMPARRGRSGRRPSPSQASRAGVGRRTSGSSTASPVPPSDPRRRSRDTIVEGGEADDEHQGQHTADQERHHGSHGDEPGPAPGKRSAGGPGAGDVGAVVAVRSVRHVADRGVQRSVCVGGSSSRRSFASFSW